MSSCEIFVKRFHRVSFSKEGFADCPVIFLEAWQATRPMVSGKPAGEYTPPSTHRLFYWLPRPCQREKQSSRRERCELFRPSAFQSFPQDSCNLKRLAQTRAAVAEVLIDRLAMRDRAARHGARTDRRQQSRSRERIDER